MVAPHSRPAPGRVCSLSTKLLYSALVFAFLAGCKIQLQAPPGTRIVADSGRHECPGGQVCTIDVGNFAFNETFRLETAPGMYADAWAAGPGHLCGNTSTPCRISPGVLEGNATFLDFLATSQLVFPIRGEAPTADARAGETETFAPSFRAQNTVSVLNQENYGAIPLSMALSEIVLGFTRTVVQRGVERMRSPAAAEYSCNGEGSIYSELEDRDESLTASLGDVLHVEFLDCLDPNLDLYLNGSVTVTLYDLAMDGESIKLEGEINYRNGISYFDARSGENADITGAHSFRYAIGNQARNPRGGGTGGMVLGAYAVGSQSTTIGNRFAPEVLSDYSLTKYAQGTGSNEAVVDAAMQIQSTVLGGRTSCASHQLRAYSVGTQICFDRTGAAIRMTVPGREVERMQQPGGSFQATGLYVSRFGEFLRNSLFDGIDSRDYPSTNSGIGFTTLALAANDGVYDAARGRVLFARSSASSGAALVAYDLNSLSAEVALELSDTPSHMVLSHDGQFLHMAFEAAARIVTYDLASLQVRHSYRYHGGGTIKSLVPSPVDSSEYAFSQRWESASDRPYGSVETTVVRNGKALGGTYSSLNSTYSRDNPEEIAYTGDGAALIGRNTSSLPAAVTRMALGSNGIESLQLTRRRLGQQLATVGDKLFDTAGMYSSPNVDKVASFSGWPGQAYSIEDNAIYVLSFNRIRRYQLDNLRLVGQGDLSIRDVTKTVPAGDYLFFLQEDQVLRMTKADVPATSETACAGFTGVDEQGHRVFDCGIEDVVYHATTNRLIAGSGRNGGQLGNSILILNPQTLDVEQAIPTVMEPYKIALSGNGRFVYALDRDAEHVARVDLQSETVDFIPVNPFEAGYYRNRPDALYPSPVEPDTVVLELGNNTSCSFEAFVVLRGGVRLPTEITREEVDQLAGYPSYCDLDMGAFDDDGSFYGYFPIGTYNTTLVPTVISDEGIAIANAVGTDTTERHNFFEYAISDGRLFNDDGRVTDLGRFNWRSTFSNEAINGGGTAYYDVKEMYAEPRARRLHFLGLSRSSNARIYTHDMDSGALLSTIDYGGDTRAPWWERRHVVVTPSDIGLLVNDSQLLKLAPRND